MRARAHDPAAQRPHARVALLKRSPPLLPGVSPAGPFDGPEGQVPVSEHRRAISLPRR